MILRTFDRTFGKLLYLTARPSKKEVPEFKPRNILCIKLWAVGESILVLPIIKSMKEKTKAKITVLASQQNKLVFEGHKFIDEIIVIDTSKKTELISKSLSLKDRNFDAVIDFEPFTYFSSYLTHLTKAPLRIGLENRPRLYNGLGKIDEDKHASEIFANMAESALQIKVKIEPIKIILSQEDRKWASNLLKQLKKKIAVFHAGSSSTSLSRRWSEDKFAELADRLSTNGFSIILVGSNEENFINENIIKTAKQKDNIINIAGKANLKKVAALFEKADLVVANDSGPMHLAGCMGAPVIGLFGPNSPKRYGALGKFAGVYKDDRICIRPFKADFPNCNHKHMDRIETSDVITAAKKLKVKI